MRVWRNILLGVMTVATPLAFGHESLTPWIDTSQQKLGPLQSRIDALREGDTLVLESGVHNGPILVRTPGVTIDGQGQATIDGEGTGTVVTVLGDNVTLRNFAITGSGVMHDRVDAGISIRSAKDVVVEGVQIRDCLFGIDVMGAVGTVLANNDISSKGVDLGVRGDAIRLWASKNIRVQGNRWSDSRDAVSWYSENVEVSDNRGSDSRYSLHSMYSKSLVIKNNEFTRNSVGIFIMYGEGTTILNNKIEHSVGAGGIGIGTKETSSLFASGNSIVYCTTGILIDNSPWKPGSRNWFHDNTIGFNSNAVVLSTTRSGNDFRSNRFRGNTVDADSEHRSPSQSTWLGNYWDQYDGFDRNGDGVGDTPYRIKKYGDVLADQHPMAQYFVGSPVLTLIELIERLVPLSQPTEILTDPSPRLLHENKEATN